MEIDDLKDAWNKDASTGMQLPVNGMLSGRPASALNRIRSNMKKEFIATLVSYVIMLCVLFFFQHNGFFFLTASILIFTLMVPNTYYFFRFYVFYKSIGRYDLDVKNSVQKVTYELELNIELYKTYNLCITPIALLITLALVGGKHTVNFVQHLVNTSFVASPLLLLVTLLVVLASFIITYVCITWSVRCMYGKYLDQLKQIMNDLGSED